SLYQSERTTPPLRLGREASPSWCALLGRHRRAYGNVRLWSAGDTSATNERVRRARPSPSVRFAVFGPGIPRTEGRGSGQQLLPCVAVQGLPEVRVLRDRGAAPPEQSRTVTKPCAQTE